MSVNRYDASTGELVTLASGTRTWIGTKAAYEAARSAGTLPNNCLIAITDDEVDHNHYSTEETETGMYWIDGKPIYRRAYTFTTPSTIATTRTQYRFDLDFSHTLIDSIIKMETFLRYSNSNGTGWANGCWNESTNNCFTGTLLECGNSASANMKFLCSMAGGHFASQPLILVIEYTKTTD